MKAMKRSFSRKHASIRRGPYDQSGGSRAVVAKIRRQHDHIELITSENYVSPAIMQAQGSQLTNKYAEDYPGRRYYGGCEFVDIAEQLAIDRVWCSAIRHLVPNS
jgi:hypothetical protein